MDILIGGMRVIDSGCVISVNDQPIRFSFQADFQIEVRFKYTETNRQEITSTVESNILIITFSNFTNALSTTSRMPLRLGILNAKTISISFALQYIGDNNTHSVVFNYAFLEG